jgi:hypothetical protein
MLSLWLMGFSNLQLRVRGVQGQVLDKVPAADAC